VPLPFLLLAQLLACNPPSPAGQPSPEVTLHIAALNDWHGALYELPVKEDDSLARGGLPWLAGAINTLRAKHPDLLIFDGGDIFQGSWPINASQGVGGVKSYNLLGVDAAAIGNHEFDYGPLKSGEGHPLRGAIERAAPMATYHWLAANIDELQEDGSRSPWSPEGIKPTALIERSGVTIGVIGLSSADTPETTLRKHVEDLRFRDPVETVRQLAPELRQQGAQVIAAIGHLTGSCEGHKRGESSHDHDEVSDCHPTGEIGRLLTELPKGTIDVIVAGHAHTIFAQRVDDTFILENNCRGQMIGLMDLVVGPDGVNADASVVHEPWDLVHKKVDPGCEEGDYSLEPQEIGGRLVTPSAEALALVRELEAESGSLCHESGCSTTFQTRSREAEAPVGNFVADAILRTFPDADIAIQNSGGLRADLPKGTLRREHIQTLMPFDNRLLSVKMTGKQLDLLLQLGSSGAHGIMQIAGGSYHFDASQTEGTDLNGDGEVETWERRRLCSVTVGGAPLDPERVYEVATTDFLYGGGDHLGIAFKDIPIHQEKGLLREVIIAHLEEQTECLGASGPLIDPEEPRITVDTCPSSP
jgi:5'-nucleotidase